MTAEHYHGRTRVEGRRYDCGKECPPAPMTAEPLVEPSISKALHTAAVNGGLPAWARTLLEDARAVINDQAARLPATTTCPACLWVCSSQPCCNCATPKPMCVHGQGAADECPRCDTTAPEGE